MQLPPVSETEFGALRVLDHGGVELVPTVLLAKAKYEHAQGDNTSATATVREAIKLAIEIYGPDHPITKSMQSWRDSL